MDLTRTALLIEAKGKKISWSEIRAEKRAARARELEFGPEINSNSRRELKRIADLRAKHRGELGQIGPIRKRELAKLDRIRKQRHSGSFAPVADRDQKVGISTFTGRRSMRKKSDKTRASFSQPGARLPDSSGYTPRSDFVGTN